MTAISNIIPAALGLILVYYALAQVVSGIANQVSNIIKMRSRELKLGLQQLINDDAYWTEFMRHDFIQNLNLEPGIDRFTAEWVPPQTFSATLLDIVRAGQQQTGNFIESIEYLPDGALKAQLETLVDLAGGQLEATRRSIERWFDNKMDVVSTVYARKIKNIVALIGVVVVMATNADTLQIWNTLWTSPALQAAAAAEADRVLGQDTGEQAVEPMEIIRELAAVGVPFFWTRENLPDPTFEGWALKGSGLLITWLAVQLGAPFWYNLLKSLRGSGSSSGDGDEET